MFNGSVCLARLSDFPSHWTAEVVYSAGWQPFFFLKIGYFARPWKKLRYAVCKGRNAAVGTACSGGRADLSRRHSA